MPAPPEISYKYFFFRIETMSSSYTTIYTLIYQYEQCRKRHLSLNKIIIQSLVNLDSHTRFLELQYKVNVTIKVKENFISPDTMDHNHPGHVELLLNVILLLCSWVVIQGLPKYPLFTVMLSESNCEYFGMQYRE